MRYFGDVYRPPSEAASLIVQATVGCSHNTCAFCSMYKAKKFFVRDTKDIMDDLKEAAGLYGSYVKKLFLADGDALIIKTGELLRILDCADVLFPNLERVTCYASPASLLIKTREELEILKDHGLAMVYLGLESGNDQVLAKISKGYNAASIIEGAVKAKKAGIKVSVTAIAGLGSYELSEVHARDTADALSRMNPDYIGILTLEVINGTPMYTWVRDGSFKVMDPVSVLKETRLLVEQTDSEGSVFRMNHASNYLPLRGTFNTDKDLILSQIDDALAGQTELRPEWSRSL